MIVVDPNFKRPTRVIDPKTGEAISATQANVQYQEQERAKSLLQPGGTFIQPGVNAPVGYDTSAIQQQANQGLTSPFTPLNQQQQQMGQIDQSAYNRLIASGMSDAEARARIQAQRPTIADTMSNTGQGVTFNPQGGVNPGSGRLPAGNDLQSRLNAIDQEAQNRNASISAGGPGNPMTQQEIDLRKQTEIQKYNAEQQQAVAEQTQAKGQEDASAASSAAAAQVTPEMATQDAALAMVIAGLPPEAAALGPALQNYLAQLRQAETSQTALMGTGISKAGSLYEKQSGVLGRLLETYITTKDQMQGILDSVKTDQEKNITDQQKSAEARLEWERQKEERRIKDVQRKTIEAKVAQLALAGGYGSDGGLREIDEANMTFEQALTDLGMEVGLQKTDLAVRFTAMKNEVLTNYSIASLENIKDFNSQVERLSFQDLANQAARNEAEMGALKTFVGAQTTLRLNAAEKITGVAQQAVTLMNEQRAIKRQDQADAWDQFVWMKSVYGTNIPEEALAGLADRLPGFDVHALATAPTAAEIEKARKQSVGSGGSSFGIYYSFAPSQMKSSGETPSFDEYVMMKESEAIERGATEFDTSAPAMARYRAEYDAKNKEHQRTDPMVIAQRLDDRTKNSPKHIRENANKVVSDYLASGKFAEAERYVDGLGAPLSATERGDYIQALNAKRNVERISGLVEELGMRGPISGTLRGFNPYDDKIVQLNSLITQTVPGLARGIFKEVGVLTDSDIERYRATISNAALTPTQARAATQQLLETINTSIQNQIAVHTDSGLNVRDIRERFQSAPTAAVEATSADADYLRSLGY